jgi:hypothetical protein
MQRYEKKVRLPKDNLTLTYVNLLIALNIGQYNESSYHTANTASK